MEKQKRIPITCTVKDFLDIDSIDSLQGELKSIPQKSMERLKSSILTYGFSFPVFVWKNGKKFYSIDGVHRCKALKELANEGHITPKDVPVVYIKAKDRKQAKELLLAASSQYATMNKDILINDFMADLDLENIKANIEIPQIDIDALIAQNNPTENDDELPEEVKPITKTGDLWQLGRHRVLCGDSGDPNCYEVLLNDDRPSICFTDPPYGVAIGDKNKMLNSFQPSGRNLTDITSDNLNPDQLKNILSPIFSNIKNKCSDDCTFFVTAPQNGELGMMMMMMMRESLYTPRHVLIWKKNSPTFSMGLDYDYQHEPILLTWGKKHKSIMAGKHRTSVWEIDKPRACKDHPTMKPVDLYENALLNNSQEDDVAIDPFGGSGPMIIACEKTGRVGRVIELMPNYCDVIVKRYYDWCLANDRKPEIKLNNKPYKMD